MITASLQELELLFRVCSARPPTTLVQRLHLLPPLETFDYFLEPVAKIVLHLCLSFCIERTNIPWNDTLILTLLKKLVSDHRLRTELFIEILPDVRVV